MRRIVLLVAMLVLVMGATAVADVVPNPWQDVQTDVPVTVHVLEMAELWTKTEEFSLEIDNAAGVIGENAKEARYVTTLANVRYNVYVEIHGNLPDYTRFHVIIEPENEDYTGVGQHDPVIAENICTFIEHQPDTLTRQFAFSGEPTEDAVNTLVHYAIEARDKMPPVQSTTFTVIWTIEAAE